MLCNYVPPPPHQDPSLGTYSMVGGGVGALQITPTSPPYQSLHTAHTTQLQGYLHTTHNNTQQSYKTHVHKITNVPVVSMALDFFGPKWHSLHLLPFQGPKMSQFSGPTPSNAPRNDVARLKTITYRAI
jgi:hypothetical protein